MQWPIHGKFRINTAIFLMKCRISDKFRCLFLELSMKYSFSTLKSHSCPAIFHVVANLRQIPMPIFYNIPIAVAQLRQLIVIHFLQYFRCNSPFTTDSHCLQYSLCNSLFTTYSHYYSMTFLV